MSVFDVDDPVCHPGDLRIVGDHDDGLVKFPAGHFQKSDHVVAGAGVQVSGGLCIDSKQITEKEYQESRPHERR